MGRPCGRPFLFPERNSAILATSSIQTLRAAPTATVADLQDVLADRARGYHDLTVRAQQLRYDTDTGMIEVQGHRKFGLRPGRVRPSLGRD